MSEAFDTCFAELLEREGGFVNDRRDRGGATRYGITEAVARAAGYTGPMADLPLATARDIYRRAYWDAMRLDEVATASLSIAAELFDTGVNMGIGTAVRFLQTALNALNREGRDYPDMNVDGRMGAGTLAALRAYLAAPGRAEGGQVLLKALDCQQGAKYLALAAWDPKAEAFLYGWLRARIG